MNDDELAVLQEFYEPEPEPSIAVRITQLGFALAGLGCLMTLFVCVVLPLMLIIGLLLWGTIT